jgi:uncharacterized membrane protein YecN with MAPEG domain
MKILILVICGFMLLIALLLHFTGHRTAAFWVASAGNLVTIPFLLVELVARYKAKRT